ncbi:hypothetical protein QL093DRAFT_1396370 [Fusarium oxysporum]|nr:hypothetical protein QL093DRAFT_1396370 [Fusarium oxysporum]
MYLGSYSVHPFSSISSPLPSLRLAFLPPLQPHPHSLCLLYCTGTYKPASTQAVVVCASLHSFVTTFDSSPTVLLLCTFFFNSSFFFYYCFFRVRLEDNQTNLSFILLLLDNFDSSIRGHKKIIRFKKKQEARSKKQEARSKKQEQELGNQTPHHAFLNKQLVPHRSGLRFYPSIGISFHHSQPLSSHYLEHPQTIETQL